ncbi:MAG TPA: DUF4149 domain-containing protein [Thermoanaerobaculia bacterium]|jgi:hypothetical protein|nr:DUF4149 domain-containing protein [Thermoanaerobaculia bacterium]
MRSSSFVGRFETPILFFHLAAIALAIGPVLFFGAVVAPAAFRVLPTRDMAAALVSPVLSGACLIAEISFGILFATSWWLSRDGVPRLTRSLLTRLPVVGFFAVLVIRELLIPPMDRIRAEAPGLIDSLPAADPSRLLLDRYHRLATGFFIAALAVGVVVLVLTARLLSVSRAAPTPSASRPPVPKLLDLS